jgi:excisionase family DNA binding protein
VPIPTQAPQNHGHTEHDHNAEHSRATYTVLEVATLMGLSRASTYALVRSGGIPAIRAGGRWVIPKRRFHAWLDGEAVGQ